MPKVITEPLFTSPRLKVLSELFTNLTAGLVSAIFITPNFSDLSLLNNQVVLITDLIAATVCLLTAFFFEERTTK